LGLQRYECFTKMQNIFDFFVNCLTERYIKTKSITGRCAKKGRKIDTAPPEIVQKKRFWGPLCPIPGIFWHGASFHSRFLSLSLPFTFASFHFCFLSLSLPSTTILHSHFYPPGKGISDGGRRVLCDMGRVLCGMELKNLIV
jgi:hypothetical protein